MPDRYRPPLLFPLEALPQYSFEVLQRDQYPLEGSTVVFRGRIKNCYRHSLVVTLPLVQNSRLLGRSAKRLMDLQFQYYRNQAK